MASKCPSSQTQQDLGCGVLRCCDTSSCDINVQGPCICAAYGDSSPSQTGWNYSFVAQCAQNSVTGTTLGTSCSTLLGVPYAYSCYCRPKTSQDVGNVGDQIPGNAIFDPNGLCAVFKASGGSSSTSSPSPSSTAHPSSHANTLVSDLTTIMLILLLFQMLASRR